VKTAYSKTSPKSLTGIFGLRVMTVRGLYSAALCALKSTTVVCHGT